MLKLSNSFVYYLYKWVLYWIWPQFWQFWSFFDEKPVSFFSLAKFNVFLLEYHFHVYSTSKCIVVRMLHLSAHKMSYYQSYSVDRLVIRYINIVYQNRPLTIKRNMKNVTSKFSTPPKLPLPLDWPHMKISQNKKLTPRDYIYKHCVWKSATYNKKKYEKCHPKVFTSPHP